MNQFNRIILIVEAVLITLDLIFFGQAKVGMICYWSVVALYHLTEILLEKRDGE